MPGKRLDDVQRGFVRNLLSYFQQELANGRPLVPLDSIQERVANALDIPIETVQNVIKQKANVSAEVPPAQPSTSRSHKSDLPPATEEVEGAAGKPTIPVHQYMERVIAATGISRTTFEQITNEKLNIESGNATGFSTPSKKRTCPRPLTGLPGAEKAIIRRIIHDYYINEKRRPTVDDIKQKMDDHQLSFTDDLNSLNKIIKQIGFKCVGPDKRKILVERPKTRIKRVKYLRQIDQYRKENKPIIYIDETFFNSTHVESKTSKSRKSKRSVVKNKHLICAHAAGEMGFIPEALLIFTSESKTGEMDSKDFEKWLENQLIPNLPPKSVLVISYSPHHNVHLENYLPATCAKSSMITWLQEKGIEVDSTLSGAEIWRICQQHKSTDDKYKLDQMLRKYGHDVLRLPPHHPELNPFEYIWEKIKNWIAKHNVTFNLQDVEQLIREKFQTITVDEWRSICEDVRKTERIFYEREFIFDDLSDNHPQFQVENDDSDEEYDEMEIKMEID